MFYKQMENVLFMYFWCTCFKALGYSGKTTQDMPSTRVNTLSDDADDLQRQLDNEARDRMKFGRPPTIWVLHYPTKYRELVTTGTRPPLRNHEYRNKINHKYQATESIRRITSKAFGLEFSTLWCPKDSWKYKDQLKWHLSHPSCGGSCQSPVDLPLKGLLHTKASREMLFSKYNVIPESWTLVHDGETVQVFGDWAGDRPFVYGGAAHSRRYVFHSLAIRRPSEHTIGGLHFPMESQAIHVSAEYANYEEALRAARSDKSALLVVANIYKHSDNNHEGLKELVQSMILTSGNVTLNPLPLNVFSPPLKEYAAYHGSLTIPPCTEAVLWLVRAKALPMTRKLADLVESKSYIELGQSYNRLVQPLNDRKVYYFN